MPEYLYPGVYVEESDARPNPIPGISGSTSDVIFGPLVVELSAVVRRLQPNWTDFGDSDPGVTLVKTIAVLAEIAMMYRNQGIPDRTRRAAMRAVAMLATLPGPCGQTEGTLSRPRFSPGQLLNDSDLQQGVDYHREKLRRHNRELHGFGIVHGLGVRVETTSDAPHGRLHIAPGYALDRCGNDLVVERDTVLATRRRATFRVRAPLGQTKLPRPRFKW